MHVLLYFKSKTYREISHLPSAFLPSRYCYTDSTCSSRYSYFILLFYAQGSFIQDLYSSRQGILNDLSFSWSLDYLSDPNSNKIYNCVLADGTSFYLLGGVDIAYSGSTLSKNFDVTVAHQFVAYSLHIFLIDQWTAGNTLNILFDDVVKLSITPSTIITAQNQRICGVLGPKDAEVRIKGIIYHSTSTLKVSLQSSPVNVYASFGIINLSMSLRSPIGTLTEGSCIIPLSLTETYTGVCSCLTGQYLDSGSSCQNCHASCSECFGSTEKDCYGCALEYIYNSETNSCEPCASNCFLCLSSAENSCLSCTTGNILFWNQTCQNNCPSPNILDTDNSVMEVCKTPCQDAGTYMLLDETCAEDCPSSYRIVQYGFKVCNTNLTAQEIEEIKLTKQVLSDLEYSAIPFGAAIGALSSRNSAAIFIQMFSDLMKNLKYLNVNYPPKLQAFFDFEFDPPINIIPNVPESLQAIPTAQLPDKFSQSDYHSRFLVNFWGPLLSLTVLFLIMFLQMILESLCKGKKKISFILKKLKSVLQWDYALTTFTSYIVQISMYSWLEFSTDKDLSSALEIVSFGEGILFTVSTLIVFIKVLQITYIFQKIRKAKAPKEKMMLEKKIEKFTVVYSEYKDQTFFQSGFMFFFMMRVYVHTAIILYLFSQVILQITLILLVNLLMTFYLLHQRPLKSKFDFSQYLIQEIVSFIVNVCILWLSVLDHENSLNEETRELLGQVIIGCNFAFNAVSLLYLCVQALGWLGCFTMKIIKAIRRPKRPIQVMNIPQQVQILKTLPKVRQQSSALHQKKVVITNRGVSDVYSQKNLTNEDLERTESNDNISYYWKKRSYSRVHKSRSQLKPSIY